jgi:hypothetical protein
MKSRARRVVEIARGTEHLHRDRAGGTARAIDLTAASFADPTAELVCAKLDRRRGAGHGGGR